MDKLLRSRDDRIIAGVCGGLAKYFGVDSTLIRLIFIVGAFLKGTTVLIYLVLAIIMPEEGAKKARGVREIKEIGELRGAEKRKDKEVEMISESEGSKTPGSGQKREEESEGRKKLLAYSLILIGALFFVKDFIPFWISDTQLFAVILILIGIGLLVSKK